MSFLKRLIKEPLVHFAVAGAAIFALSLVMSGAGKDQIVITDGMRDYLISIQEEVQFRQLAEAERDQVIEDYVRDEILYREAYKRGLDKSDARMRRDLVRKIRELIVAGIPEPTETELRAFFEANPAQFEVPAKVTLEHVYFAPLAAPKGNILGLLNEEPEFRVLAEALGGLGQVIQNVSLASIGIEIGAEASAAVKAASDGVWFGPEISSFGVHYFRIVGRTDAQPASFENVEVDVMFLWRADQAKARLDDEINRVANQYDVILPDSDE